MKKRKVYIDRGCLYDVELETTECCGIEELYKLDEDANVNLFKVCQDSERRAMIIFHDAVQFKKGSRLARKIRREKLGKLQSTSKEHNPNSGNYIQMWIWYPDFEALDDYCKRLDFKEDDYYNW